MAAINSQGRDDFATVAVPLQSRYSPLSMGLLWITMVSGFPSVLVGFEWHKAHFSLQQVLAGGLLSCSILFCYVFAASQLGAATGLNFALLTQSVFGKRGSQIVSFVQSVLFLVWYALIAVFVAQELKGLFPGWSILPAIIAALAAVLMAANNLFGFAGVANFARFVAAPALILWIIVLFFKTSSVTSTSTLFDQNSVSFASSLSVISSYIIGYSVWGNEPDFWRFGKPKLLLTALPLLITILIGQIIFPLSGWMLAHHLSADPLSPASATAAVNHFSFGGMPVMAALVLTVSYFAAGDANLYGAINAIENLHMFDRRRLVLVLMIATALCAVVLTFFGKAFEVLSSFNAILLPCVTIILVAEYFLLRKKFGAASGDTNFSSIAMGPLLLGWLVGIITAGVIPGTQACHCGIWPLYAWGTALISYLVLRCRSAKVGISDSTILEG